MIESSDRAPPEDESHEIELKNLSAKNIRPQIMRVIFSLSIAVSTLKRGLYY